MSTINVWISADLYVGNNNQNARSTESDCWNYYKCAVINLVGFWNLLAMCSWLSTESECEYYNQHSLSSGSDRWCYNQNLLSIDSDFETTIARSDFINYYQCPL